MNVGYYEFVFLDLKANKSIWSRERIKFMFLSKTKTKSGTSQRCRSTLYLFFFVFFSFISSFDIIKIMNRFHKFRFPAEKNRGERGFDRARRTLRVIKQKRNPPAVVHLYNRVASSRPHRHHWHQVPAEWHTMPYIS